MTESKDSVTRSDGELVSAFEFDVHRGSPQCSSGGRSKGDSRVAKAADAAAGCVVMRSERRGSIAAPLRFDGHPPTNTSRDRASQHELLKNFSSIVY